MKKLSSIILVLAMASFILAITPGCDSGGGTTPTPQDTTDNNDTTTTGTVEAGFKIGVADEFDLVLDKNLSYATWDASDSSMYISIGGEDVTRPENEQKALIELNCGPVPNKAGTYNASNNNATIGLQTGSGIKEQQFASDGLSCTIKIEEWGGPGGRAKGTFNAKVKDIQNSFDVKNGYFDVEIRD
ncbi:hypothetical protein GYB22_02765 [bacterium]|nr:hypothetical protein [bacterium]